jgi:hypothetical protein
MSVNLFFIYFSLSLQIVFFISHWGYFDLIFLIFLSRLEKGVCFFFFF